MTQHKITPRIPLHWFNRYAYLKLGVLASYQLLQVETVYDCSEHLTLNDGSGWLTLCPLALKRLLQESHLLKNMSQ